jgi:hypothetical protein
MTVCGLVQLLQLPFWFRKKLCIKPGLINVAEQHVFLQLVGLKQQDARGF